ncbi:MAG: LptF/LptG family permease [Robiginitomaculum sp.]|nr:LptF/LptG family permease [Robiginitomaculum sp.]
MTLIQKYFRRQFVTPLLLSLSALSILAILTQSLSTIDLIVENRQTAFVFLYITILTLPQLLGIIMPIAVFLAMLYALNRLNVDSELVITKAAGLSPWQITIPALHIAAYAMIAHLIINLFLQPYAFRERRAALLEISTDVASRMINVGEFKKIAPALTVYTSKILPSGRMLDILIYDESNSEMPLTYMAQEGQLTTANAHTNFTLYNGNINFINSDNTMNITEFTSYTIDLTQALSIDSKLRLKPSDLYINELFELKRTNANLDTIKAYRSEGHMRLATPLYNIALVLLALAVLVRGEHNKLGYGKKIAIAATIGFILRLIGFGLTSAAENNALLNIAQYGVPLSIGLVSLLYLLNPRRVKLSPRFKAKRRIANRQET